MSYVHHSTIYTSQDMEATQVSINRWMDKEDVIFMSLYIYIYIYIYIYMYNGILLSHKKEWNIAICNNIDGPRDYHTDWSKSDKERQIFYAITYM